ncbi:terminase large subunit [Serratia phage BUCT660]|nr:terminase large subunit [Serratia phage BUCT660]
MILHKKDWDKFPSAIPHISTKNKSFKRFVGVLQKMGIENCWWPLALLNPELANVDPFDPNLTDSQKAAVKLEAEYNIWYYLRECVLVPNPAGDGGDMFRANRANMSLIWSYMNHVAYLLIQPRQTGKSISSYVLYSWLLYIKYRKTRISLVTKSDELRAETTTKVRQIRELLPPYMTITDKTDTIAGDKATYNVRQNLLAVAVSRSDPAGANKVGRGNTSPTVGWDEAPFITHIKIAYTAAMPGMNAAIKAARDRGMPYGTIMTTTAGEQTDRDGEFIHKMWTEAAPWTEHFLDAGDQDKLEGMVKLSCKGRQVLINGTWSHTQVGVSDREHYDNMARAQADGPEADRDFFNIWTSGGANNPLDKGTLAQIVASQRYSDYSEVFAGGYVIHWYLSKEELEERRPNLQMIVGADTSEGGGNDALTLIFTDPYDLSVLGTSVINEALIPKYAEFLHQMLVRYPKSVFIPERKSTGQTFIDYLCIMLHKDGIDPFTRIYNTIVNESDSDRVAFQEIKGSMDHRDDSFYIRRKTKFGFCTGTTTRRTLYSEILQIAGKKGASRVHDKVLISELTGLVSKNGRVDHASGKHDDTVIAWLLSVWLLVYGRNLDYYGIDARRVMTRALESSGMSKEEEQRHMDIEALQRQIESTLEQLKSADSPALAIRYEKRITHLSEMLSEMGIDSVNISGKIEEINDERRRKVYNNYY